MSKKNIDIAFLGLAQNCEIYLDNFFKVLNEVKKKNSIKVLIGENDSKDLTFDKIHRNILINDDIQFIDTTFIEKFNDRIERLALAREELKVTLEKLDISPKFVCVVDLDDVLNSSFNANTIYDLIETLQKNKSKYFAISVKSKPYYYDILNFESDEFINHNVKSLQNNKKINSYSDRKKKIYDLQLKLTLKENFDCISGFNGMCIYFYEDYIKSNYYDPTNNNDITPEHLYLNRKLNKITGKKLFVENYFLQMPYEHKPLTNIFLFISEKLIKYIGLYLKKFS